MARVLIVEDSHAQAVALRQILESEGHDVTVAENGEEGLEHARTNTPELILSDVIMPRLSGYDLCRTLKSDPKTSKVPVILLTTLKDASDILHGLECGADNFVTKPYDEKHLRRRIQTILSDHRGSGTEGAGNEAGVRFHGRDYTIAAGKQRILDYLLSTYEDFVRARESEHRSREAAVSLREALRFVQSTLDALMASIAILDHAGEIIAVNSGWRASPAPGRLLGSTLGAGVNYLDLCDDAAREAVEGAGKLAAGIRAVMANRQPSFRLEYPARGDQGDRWFLARVTRFTHEGPVRVVVAHSDITERKQAEAALRESQRALSTLMSNLPGLAYRCAPDREWTFRFVSEGCVELTGYGAADLVGNRSTSYSRLLHVDDRDWVTYARRAAIRAGVPFRLVYRITTSTRAERWVWEQGRAVLDANGRVVAIEGIIADVTERKMAEAAMAEEAQISAALARVGRELIASANAPDLLERLCELTTDVLGCDFTRTWLLQTEEDAFAPTASYGDTAEQREEAQLIKIPREALAPHLAMLERDEVFQRLLPEEDPNPVDRFAQQFGTTSCLHLALRRGTKMIGFLTAGYRGRRQEFTTLQARIARGLAHLTSMGLETARLVEELEHANRFKSDFLAAMSHELRTPLNVIIGYNSLLMEEAFGPLTEGQLDTSKRMDKNARELLELVSATLDLTRFDSKRVPLNIEELDVSTFMDEVARETGPLLQKPGLDVFWQVGKNLPVLHTDALKLRMVLKNLIGNAIKFTEQGSVNVSAQAARGGVEFGLTDTGIGIAPSKCKTIFEPFEQAHNSISQRYGGAGLGLYLVKRIVTMLGGHIRVESELGKGSTFRVWFPTRVDRQPADVQPAEASIH